VKAGFRLFDTAQAAEWYDEEALGRALLHCPVEDTVVIVTKIHPRYFEAESLRESVSRSRQRLYPDQANRPLDVVLLHAPWCWWEGHCTDEQKTHSWREAWRVLEALRDEGLVKAIGVSNFDAEQLRELLEFSNRKVSVVQNWMDPLHQDRAVRALAADHGIIYMAYSSFGTQWQSKSSILNPVLSEPVLAKVFC
jgi:2,5-diketo-D-gluconate reductase A